MGLNKIMLNDKNHSPSLLRVLSSLLRAIFYYVLSIFIATVIVLTCPVWMPVYFWFTSLHKSFLIMRALVKLPFKVINPPEKSRILAYGILRGNGKYLKGTSKDVFVHQLYDYAVRRFLTVKQVPSETRIVELECLDRTGIEYLADSYSITRLLGNTSNVDVYNKLRKVSHPVVRYSYSNYKTHYLSQQTDCMIAFDLKSKLSKEFDLLSIFKFVKENISDNGFAVFGQYFEEGQISVFQTISRACYLETVAIEDITKNIEIANKIIYRQRVQTSYDYYIYDKLKKILDMIQEKLEKVIGFMKRAQQRKFTILILEKAKPSKSHRQ